MIGSAPLAPSVRNVINCKESRHINTGGPAAAAAYNLKFILEAYSLVFGSYKLTSLKICYLAFKMQNTLFSKFFEKWEMDKKVQSYQNQFVSIRF